jgi:hypothetical protein
MSKLQQLLDKKWPITDDLHFAKRTQWNFYRDIFTEGYNAAKSEAKEQVVLSINNAYPGREGCTWGDTEYDSLTVAYGYRIALQDAEASLRNI